MNLLIVDDEYEVIAGMMQSIDFEKLGFENVYTALDARHAREILERFPVDILLTDIEMPLESGIELLTWVRDSGLEIVSLFCTSYANFDYAQKAVELHSFDYYLKPIEYSELTGRLRAAAAEVERGRSARNLQKYGSLWLSSREDYKFSFWHRAILGSVSGQSLSALSKDSLLDYTGSDCFAPAILLLTDESAMLEQWKKYAFKNITAEIFSGDSAISAESLIPLSPFSWCVIFQAREGFSEKLLLRYFSELSVTVKLHLSASVSLYYCPDATLDSIHSDYRLLHDVFSDDVLRRRKTVNARRYQKRKFAYRPPDLENWGALLLKDSGRFYQELCRYLDELSASGTINLAVLQSFRIDLLQLFHAALQPRHIDIHELYGDDRFNLLFDSALLSVSQMKHCAEYLTGLAARSLSEFEQSQSAVGRVREYIGSHLSEKITRTSMAKLVYLNSDYLARVFKKETGVSLGEYLQEQRINEAKRLLSQTETPVSVISQNVGYDNFSYFSYLFHERTGMTPLAYRKKFPPEFGICGKKST